MARPRGVLASMGVMVGSPRISSRMRNVAIELWPRFVT